MILFAVALTLGFGGAVSESAADGVPGSDLRVKSEKSAIRRTSSPLYRAGPNTKLAAGAVKAVNKPAAAKTARARAAHRKKGATPRKTGNVTPLSEYELGKYQYCGNDSDCVVAVNGCCDCANGGQEVAINKGHVEDLKARFDCLYMSCNKNFADPHCGNGVVSCIGHKCHYFDDAVR